MPGERTDDEMTDKYSISMLVPGMPFSGDTLDAKSLGGSETAGLSLARELRRLGHHVTMFANCGGPALYDLHGNRIERDDPGGSGAIRFYPVEHWASYATCTPHDVCIVQRTPEPLNVRTVSKLNLLWCHDIALGRQAAAMRGAMWNCDGVITLSDWQRQNYKKVYGFNDEMLISSRNGIDLARFPQTALPRNRKRLVYSARPERGLDMMFDIFAKILERDPDFELALFGYDNPVDHLRDFYAGLEQRAASFGDKARFVGRLGKRDLYREYAQSGIYTYPTPSPNNKGFYEISCISAMEAQAAGMPVVASNRGALTETVAEGAGVLIDGDPWDEDYQDRFADAVVKLANDETAYAKASAAGIEAAKAFDWSGVAEEWTGMFADLFARRNDCPVRLARHFLRRSDVFAAKAALKGSRTKPAVELRQRIAADYAFAGSDTALKAHYVEGGKATATRLDTAGVDHYDFVDTQEKRFTEVLAILEKRTDCQRILDFGCGHGWFDIWAEKKIGREWLGIDIDPGAIEWSRKYADAHATMPGKMMFKKGDHTVDLVPYNPPFDCLIVSEVLEHCRDPRAAIHALEKWVRPGGLVIVTTPYGPSEYWTPNWDNFRNHLWEFETADLEDLFCKKPKISIGATFDHANEATGETCGFHLVTYEADHEPLGKIDMARKLRVQSPRQTLSVSIMAGPNAEDMMRWTLKSIAPVADEIIIADTGLNARGLEAAADYGARLIKGSDPKVVGFETPRNEGLEACACDWVLWIDTDEKLLNPSSLTKYLREGLFHGLSIRQHHFAVDHGWTPDMPVRCFRNRPHEGKRMRFFGMIHEHPETGLNEGPGPVLVLPDVDIAHVGYLSEEIRRTRFMRNNPLMQMDMKKYPNRMLQKHFMLRDMGLLNMYELQQNGNRVTDQIRMRAERMVEIYREHFHGKKTYTNVDSLQYYSQALRVLGLGIEVQFSLGAVRDGQGKAANGVMQARFASPEEAERDIGFRIRDAMEPLMPEHGW